MMLTLPLLLMLAAPPAGKAPSVLVLGIQSLAGVPADVATLMTETAVTHLQASGRFSSVTARADVNDALSMEQQRQLADCNTMSCMAEIANAMGADYLLSGTVGKLGAVYVVNLRLFSTRTSGVAAAASRTLEAVDEGALIKVVPLLVEEILVKAPFADPGARKRVPPPQATEQHTERSDDNAADQGVSRRKAKAARRRAAEERAPEPLHNTQAADAPPSSTLLRVSEAFAGATALLLPPSALALAFTNALAWTIIALALISNANTGWLQQVTGGSCYGLALLGIGAVCVATPLCLVTSASGPGALITQWLWGRGQATMRRRVVDGGLVVAATGVTWLGIASLIASPILVGVGIIVAAAAPTALTSANADKNFSTLPIAGLTVMFAGAACLTTAMWLLPLGLVSLAAAVTGFVVGEL